jgi:glycosyltransferase involved in cell wall biosynthesis
VTRPFSIICVSPQPWHAELPTNRQQVMRRAARFGHDVVFVETAHFLGRDVWRLIRSRGANGRAIVRRLAAGERVAPRITVRTAPWLAPWARRYRWANRLDTALTRILVRRLVRRTHGPVVLWLYDAASSSLVGRCGEAASVYDCVDDHVEVAGGNPRVRALLAAADSQAAIASDLVFTTTRSLYERHRTANPLTHLVPNVGDYHHFAQAASRSIAADDVAALPRPLLGFTGNVAAWKVDFALLTDVARRRPDWTLALVGPTRADTVDALVRLTALPNVHYLGARPYERLPAYVAAFDVGLCPYLWNAAMRSGFPLKLFEYLAAGKAVVASGNPDVAGMAPDVRLVRGADAFIRAVEEVLTLDGDADRARRMALAAANTWESRTAHMLELVGPHVKT